MITPSPPQRRRSARIPRRLPRRAIPEPISSAYAGFFGGAGFYVRVGMLAAVALSAFAILGLRLWSLQVLQGPAVHPSRPAPDLPLRRPACPARADRGREGPDPRRHRRAASS